MARHKRRAERKTRVESSKKFRISVATVLGLVLAIGSMVLQLRAKPTVSLEPPLDPDQVLTSQFAVVNAGELSLNHVQLTAVIKNFRDARDNIVSDSRITFQPVSEIEPGGRLTIPGPFGRLVRDPSPIVAGEFGIIVSYRPSYYPFTKMKGFRFTIARQSDGRSRFIQQPEGNIVEEYKAMLARGGE